MQYTATVHLVCNPSGDVVVSLLPVPKIFLFFFLSRSSVQNKNILIVPLSSVAQTVGCFKIKQTRGSWIKSLHREERFVLFVPPWNCSVASSVVGECGFTKALSKSSLRVAVKKGNAGKKNACSAKPSPD